MPDRPEQMEKAEVVGILRELIATCQDGEEGFRTAAEGVFDSELRDAFRQYSRERKAFADELEQVARRMGTSPDTSGSLAGVAHQAWMDVTTLATLGDPPALVRQVERGQHSAMRVYERALAANLPQGVRPVVQRQFTRIRVANDQLEILEKRYERP